MRSFTLQTFTELLQQMKLQPRLKADLRFISSTAHMKATDWKDLELIAIKNKSGNKGVLLVELDDVLYVLPSEFRKAAPSATTGRPQPIICDFCATWQSGQRAGGIVFTKVKNGTANIGYLCCADLACSSHVRTKTDASKMSRAQLREDLDDNARVERLKQRLKTILDDLQVSPITSTNL